MNRHPLSGAALATAMGVVFAALLFFGLSACGGGDTAPIASTSAHAPTPT